MDSLPMNPIDMAVLGVVLLSAFLAFSRGFLLETLSIGGWVVAYFGSLVLAPKAEPVAAMLLSAIPALDAILSEFVSTEKIVRWLSLIGTFCALLVVCAIVSHFVARRVRGSALNAVDRSLGFVFGTVRGALLVSLAYLLASWIWQADEQPVWLKQARARPLLAAGADMLRDAAPEEFRISGVLKPQEEENAGATPEYVAPQPRVGKAAADAILNRLAAPAPAPNKQSQPGPGYSQTDRANLDAMVPQNN